MKRDSEKLPFPLHHDHDLHSQADACGKSASGREDKADLKRRVINFLASRNRPALRQLKVEVEDGVVVLTGRVRSFYDKQLASHCCGRVAGVRRVVDDIDVIPELSVAK